MKPNNVVQPETFRDSLGTMKQDGKRQWIYPKKPKGKFTNYRTYVSWLLLAILFITPFIKIDGNPMFMINVVSRKFSIMGKLFFPTDMYLFAIGGITTFVFIILFTLVYGRLFCGWICPQTIFMEMVFRKIEYAIEGDSGKQKKLDRMEWNEEKIKKRVLKWTIFAIISTLIAHTFLSYILGVEVVYKYITEGPSEHWGLFLGLLIFTGLFYFVFTWFREQACTLVCPYGRLQGVLINKDTINVAYDYKRGEGEKGRGKFKRQEDRPASGKGDCIDCNQCVAVCPTGIDIRDGVQLECVNCTACIDACDDMMDKVGLPLGLIRYASENNIAKGEEFKFTKPMVVYTIILGFLVALTTSLLVIRADVEAKILKYPGKIFVEEGEYIVNEYQLMLINKTNEDKKLHIKLLSHEGKTDIFGPEEVILHRGKEHDSRLEIRIKRKDVKKSKEDILIGIYDETGKKITEYKTGFTGPFKL